MASRLGSPWSIAATAGRCSRIASSASRPSAQLAGHLHDDTLQALAVARQDLDEAKAGDDAALAAVASHLDEAVAGLRHTLVHMHPGSLAVNGLGPAIDAYAEQVLRRTSTTRAVDVDPEVGEHQALLYSLARELLGNVAKLARAGTVRFETLRDEDVIRLTVADDGVGFSSDECEAPGHFGLLTARGRRGRADDDRLTAGHDHLRRRLTSRARLSQRSVAVTRGRLGLPRDRVGKLDARSIEPGIAHRRSMLEP